MPPRRRADDFGLRLKHGIHTVYLSVSSTTTFGELEDTLLPILRERYPDGLTSYLHPLQKTAVPREEEPYKIVWGTMVDVTNEAEGWQVLKVKRSDTLGQKKLYNRSGLAFEFVREHIAAADFRFRVEIPYLDEEEN